MNVESLSSPAEPDSFTVVIPAQQAADDGRFELDLHIARNLAVAASDARRVANRYIHRNISYLLRAEQPQIVLDFRSPDFPSGVLAVSWRVPLVLTMPSLGTVGEVGYLNVDVEDGSVVSDEAHIELIRKSADDLVARTPYQTAPAG